VALPRTLPQPVYTTSRMQQAAADHPTAFSILSAWATMTQQSCITLGKMREWRDKDCNWNLPLPVATQEDTVKPSTSDWELFLLRKNK